MEAKDKEKLIEMLPNEFRWEVIPAVREHKKGRAKGGLVIGLNKLWIMNKKVEIEKIGTGLARTDIRGEREKWRIWSIYNDNNLKKYLEEIEKEEITEGRFVIVGGDFNVRIGEGGDN